MIPISAPSLHAPKSKQDHLKQQAVGKKFSKQSCPIPYPSHVACITYLLLYGKLLVPQCCWFIFPSLFLSIHLCLRLQPLPKARSKTCLPAQETKWTSPPTSMTPAAADSETLRKTFVVFGLVNHINNHMPQHILSSAVGEIFCFCDSESKRFQKSTRSKFQS